MIAVLILVVVASAALAVAYGERTKRLASDASHVIELESYKKVGKWYQGRVEELEFEAQQLAGQIVESGIAPRANAMPIPARDDHEYASDPTGLVVERLDPRDLPAHL